LIAKLIKIQEKQAFSGFNQSSLKQSGFKMYSLPEILLNLFIRQNTFLGCHINHAITKAPKLLETS